MAEVAGQDGWFPRISRVAQPALADALIADLEAWELVGRLERFLAEMETRLEHLSDDDESTAAIEWLAWCQRYMAEKCPFSRPIQMPRTKPPSYSIVAAFRKLLGFVSLLVTRA
jgi:hypothetical protein